MKFSDLLEPHGGMLGSDLQLDARRRFPETVRTSPLVLRSKGWPPPTGGNLIVIGIADYSRIDLALLDDIVEAINGKKITDRIEVFNTSECTTVAQLEEMIPKIDSYTQTPILAVWEGGYLVHQTCGGYALDYLRRRYGLPRGNQK